MQDVSLSEDQKHYRHSAVSFERRLGELTFRLYSPQNHRFLVPNLTLGLFGFIFLGDFCCFFFVYESDLFLMSSLKDFHVNVNCKIKDRQRES